MLNKFLLSGWLHKRLEVSQINTSNNSTLAALTFYIIINDARRGAQSVELLTFSTRMHTLLLEIDLNTPILVEGRLNFGKYNKPSLICSNIVLMDGGLPSINDNIINNKTNSKQSSYDDFDDGSF